MRRYELKLKDKSSAVVQLGLSYTLSYTLHQAPSTPASSLTMHPSSAAREFIRQQLIDYAARTSTRYRFIDYFCVVGCADPQLPSSSSSSPSNTPTILARYPDEDHPDVALPNEVSMFAFNDGYSMSVDSQPPQLYSFRLNADMDQLMVTCLLYWQETMLKEQRGQGGRAVSSAVSDFILPNEEVVARGPSQSVAPHGSVVSMFVPRVLLLTSRLSYVAQHREILTHLYHHFFYEPPSTSVSPSLPTVYLPCPYTATSPSAASATLAFPCRLCCPCTDPIRLDCTGQPFESYLTLLTQEVPLPESGGTPIELTVGCRTFRLSLPALELDFPHVEFDVAELFQVLDVETVLMTMRCVLSEMKLLFYSTSRSLLHSVSECIIALCFPFTWSHVYVPLLPKSLLGIIEAPVSFILGIHSSTPPDLEHISDLSSFAVIDIDRSVIDLAQPPPAFPAHAVRVLLKGLRRLVRPSVFKADEVRESGGLQGEAEFYQKLHPRCGGGRCSRVCAAAVASAATASASTPSFSAFASLKRQEEAERVAIAESQHTNRLIRHEFFAFLCSLLHGYRVCLSFDRGITPKFSTADFLASPQLSSDQHPFLSRFLETQLFRDFLDRHVEMPSFLTDYLEYIDCTAGAGGEGRLTAPYAVPQRPARTMKDWATLIHPHAQLISPRPSVARPKPTPTLSPPPPPPAPTADEADPPHWASLTSPLPPVLNTSPPLDNPFSPRHRESSNDEAASSSTASFSSSLVSPVAFHRDRLQSVGSPHLRNASFGESMAHGRTRTVAGKATTTAVVSLAPAVTTFTSSQTLGIVTAGGQGARAWSGVDNAELDAPSQPDLPPLTGGCCYRPWLMDRPRELKLQRTGAGGAAEAFASAKNPSTLLHAPLPAMALGPDGKIEIVGGFRPEPPPSSKKKANRASAQPSTAVGAASASTPRQSIVIEGQGEGEEGLQVAINSPKPVRSAALLNAPPSPSPSTSPSPSGADVSPHSPTSPTHRRRRSRHDSFSSTIPQIPPRPQSNNLISKSELELRKPAKDRRLNQLLSAVFSRGGGVGGQVIDVGELSAVGELLALRDWRAALVNLIGGSYGGYEPRRSPEGRDRDRRLEVEAFNATLLLFNVALEECAVESDFVHAYALLQFAEKLYTIQPTASPRLSPQTSPASSVMPHPVDRVYLLPKLKRQPLWHVRSLWVFVYSAEVHRRRHGGVYPSQACERCSEAPPSPPDAALRELCLDVLVQVIGTQVSLGCHEVMLQAFVEEVLKEDGELLAPHRGMLLQLISQAVKAALGLRGSARSSAVSSPTSAVHPLLGSSGGAADAAPKGDFTGVGGGRQVIDTGVAAQGSPMPKYHTAATTEFRLDV